MKRTIAPLAAGLLLFGLAGCQNRAQPSAASAPSAAVASNAAPPPSPAPPADQSPNGEIRTAIEAHLAHNSNLNLKSFDTDLKQVTIKGDHAEAQVEFRVKGGPGAMQLTYQLQKQGGAWAVIESNPVGSNFSHPALNQGQTSSAQGTPGAAPDSLADTLRSFKQGGFGTPQSLPPGHPSLNQ